MESTTIYIKNMVCDRCKAAVNSALRDIGLKTVSVELGIAVVESGMTNAMREETRRALEALGFGLLDNRQQQTAERIKNAIIELVHYKDNKLDAKLSVYLSAKVGSDYSALSKLFSEQTGMTIEKYLILQKTERVKELIFNNEMSLSEIAASMNYSSVAYLSTQFKQVTGMTPTQFKAMGKKELRTLDSL